MRNLLRKFLVCVLITASLVVLYAIKPIDDRAAAPNGSVAVADETTGSTTSGDTTPGAGTTTPAAGALPEGVSQIQLLYTREEIIVTSTQKVYYAQLKKPTDNTVKPADIIPASKMSDSTYMIDISCFSPSKDLYLGVATKLLADANGMYPVYNCKIPSTYKKVVFNVNFAAEGDRAAGNGILKNVIVSNTDGTTVTYDHSGTTSDKVRPISQLSIEWRKGNNCAYSSISTLTPAIWESMKTSGAIIYLRLGAVDGLLGGTGHRYSQESKIKLAIIKSKGIKVDVSKLTVPITNGMQFRLKNNETWITVLPYDGKSTVTKAIRNATLASTPFDPYTESTSEKVKELSISDIYAVYTYTPPSDQGTSVEFEVRVAATSKKPASRISTFKIPYQYAGPVVEAKKSGADVTFSSITNSPQDKVSGKYEYAIVDKADISADNIVYSQMKWFTIKTGTVLKTGTNIKGTYARKDGSRKTVNFGDAGSVVLVRRSGIKESKKNAAVLASKYTVIDPTALSSGTTDQTGGTDTPGGGGETPGGGGETPGGGGGTPGGGGETPGGGGETPGGGGETPGGGGETPGGGGETPGGGGETPGGGGETPGGGGETPGGGGSQG